MPATLVSAPDNVLRGQELLLRILETGGGHIDGEPVAALPYFSGLAMLWSLLDDDKRSNTVWGCLQMGAPADRNSGASRHGSFESTGIARRTSLLLGATEIIANGYSNFIHRLAAVGVNSSLLLRYSSLARQRAPWWYEKPVKQFLDRASYVPAMQEIESAIRYLAKTQPGRVPRANHVCALLGMATVSSRRVAGAIRTFAESSATSPD